MGRRGACRAVRVVIALCLLAMAPTATGATVSTAAASDDSWAAGSVNFLVESQIDSGGLALADPEAPMTRGRFVALLAGVDRYRAERAGVQPQLSLVPSAPALPDAPSTSLLARAVQLGWIDAPGGRALGNQAVTTDSAARGMVALLGLQSSMDSFAVLLRREVRGTRRAPMRAAHVYVRAMGMRYNHPAGREQLEAGSGEAMRVGQIAIKAHRAALLDSWQVGQMMEYESFDLPAVSGRRRRMMRNAVALIGQPYVWAGESERMQPEGHAGFDCSGFVVRVVQRSRLRSGERRRLKGRTSMSMSDVGRRKRIPLRRLKPADVIFFGDRGPRSRPSENFHAALYMGNGWFIHSSGGQGGVSITRLDGWWAEHYSWGVRLIRGR